MSVPYAEVIGDPVAHSKSPLIHEFWLEKLGLEGEYRAIRVAAEALPAYLETRRGDPDWRGCSVTLPHKEKVLPLLDGLAPDAQEAGAVNLVIPTDRHLTGHNSDVTALRDEIVRIAGEASLRVMAVVVIGAGGAARAVLQVLRDVPDLEVWILNRDLAKADALLRHFGLTGRAAPLEAQLPPAYLIVNASSLGMAGFPDLPLDPRDAGKPYVVDLVYSPVETGLLRRARESRMLTTDGISMLIGQARIAFEYLFRLAPPPGCEEELRGLLSQ